MNGASPSGREVGEQPPLRASQQEPLEVLAIAIAATPDMTHPRRDVAALLETLTSKFPKLSDFGRIFPSLCFALATGAGKTRLMGASKNLHRATSKIFQVAVQGYCLSSAFLVA